MNALLPLAWLYGFGVWIRNLCYDAGIFAEQKARVPVISVGNITAGGTGKTPMTEYLIGYYLKKGKKVAVLSRGYKRGSKETVAVGAGETERGNAELLGDELFQISRKYTNITVIAEPKRTLSATIAVERYDADVLILDDGFQHRALARDLDIVMLTGETSVYEIPLLPAGMRRDILKSLERANVMAFSNSSMSKDARLPKAVRIEVQAEPVNIRQVFGTENIERTALRGAETVVFSGIANPERFYQSVQELGVVIRERITFPDHHRFTHDDVIRIAKVFAQHKPKYILTTEKDAMRLLPFSEVGMIPRSQLYYVAIEMRVTKGEQEFHQILDSIM